MNHSLEDISRSRSAALQRDGWLYGELMNRIGDPFTWIDGDQIEHIGGNGYQVSILQYLSMSGEIYITPDAIRSSDHDEMLANIRSELGKVIECLFPYAVLDDLGMYLDSTASVKAQDYSAIKSWTNDIPDTPVHIDIGPGLGANAIYSRIGLNAQYTAIESYPISYEVQRRFLRAIIGREGLVFDCVDAECLGLSIDALCAEVELSDKYTARIIPSWHFNLVPNLSADLFSATWVLNEITAAGICWILFHVSRILKEGGYFYIRDSGLLKPMRHNLNYDEALLELGFEQINRANVVNRVDMHGIPRIFRKYKNIELDFKAIYNKYFGHFAVSSHGGAYNQK